MKHKKNNRKRFDKPYRMVSRTIDKPARCLAEIFTCFQLKDFEKNLSLWKKMALANDESAYDNAATRENLMYFCCELQRLSEAFYLLNKGREQWHTTGRRKETASTKTVTAMDETSRLKMKEKSNPQLVIRNFCTRFSFVYAKTEILDILEAVITYDGYRKKPKENIVLFYQCLEVLVNLAYTLSNGRQCLQHLKKTIRAGKRLTAADL